MEQPVELPEKVNPFASIWFRPRKTFLYLLPRFMEKHVIVLAALFGFLHMMHQSAQEGQGDFLPLELIFLISLIVGSLGGYAIVYLVGIYIPWVFSWFKVQISSQDVRWVMAWSLLPYILSLLLFVPFMLIYGQNWFESTVIISSPLVMTLIPLLSNLQYLLIGWSLMIFLVGIASLSRTSEAKSLLVVLTGAAAIILPVGLVYIFLIPKI